MSLELAIQENTNTMKQLIAAWNALTVNATKIKAGEPFSAGGVPIVETEVKTADPKVIAGTATVPAKTAATVAGTADPKSAVVSQPSETAAALPVSKPEASPPAPSTATVTYEDVRALVLRVSKEKGRDVAAAVLALFGVAKAPELKPEQYADVVAHFKSELSV